MDTKTESSFQADIFKKLFEKYIDNTISDYVPAKYTSCILMMAGWIETFNTEYCQGYLQEIKEQIDKFEPTENTFCYLVTVKNYSNSPRYVQYASLDLDEAKKYYIKSKEPSKRLDGRMIKDLGKYVYVRSEILKKKTYGTKDKVITN